LRQTESALVDGEEYVRRGRSRIVIAFAIGVTLAICVAEVTLRAFVSPTALLDPASDAYWRAHFATTPDLAPDIEYDAQLGWRMRRDFHGDGVTHDADGHRVTPDAAAIDASKRPVVFLGDSFTYGLGVRDDETYAAKFAESLRDRTVVNLAANGHGLDQQVLAFETEGVTHNPALVVVGYFVDDFRRNGLTFREAQKPCFQLKNESLSLAGVPVPPPAVVRATIASASGPRSYAWAGLATLWARLAHSRGAFASDTDFDRHAQLSAHLLARLKRSTDAIGAKLLVIVIPHCTYDGYQESRRIETAIEESCKQLAIWCIPTRAADMEAETAGVRVFGPACHWSPAGHELAARLLLAKLDDQRFER